MLREIQLQTLYAYFMAYCKPALIVLTFKKNLSEKSMIFTKEEKKKQTKYCPKSTFKQKYVQVNITDAVVMVKVSFSR